MSEAAPLRRAALGAGRYFGAAVRADQLAGDDRLRAVLLRDCSVITPEIHLKWDAVEPAPGAWRHGAADDLVAFGKDHGIQVRGHTLIWEQSTPRWARERLLHDRDWALVDRWFGAVLPRYRDAIRQWDVVNEPIDTEHGDGGMRRTSFQRAFGNDYVERALRAAHAQAPAAALYINDYSFDYANPVDAARRTALLRLIERLKRRDVPIHGIGLQAHLDLAKGALDEAGLGRFLREVAGFGLEIAVTELDVRESDRRAPLPLRDRRVADAVAAYLGVVLAEPAVKGVITWGLSDRDSWLQDQDSRNRTDLAGLNRGLPYDALLGRKPMYWTIRQAFAEARAIA